MTSDLVGLAFAVQGALCTGSVFAVWKLHGESKFGKHPQEEMTELRGKVLRSISQSLVDTFEPILTYKGTAEVPNITPSENDPHPKSPMITIKGKETLLNAVRDFVKSDIEMLKSLRALDSANACVTHSLIWFRRLSIAMAVSSGFFLLVAGLEIYAVFAVEPRWPHAVGLAVLGALLFVVVIFIFRLSHAVNISERLKEKHADLS